MGNKTSTYFISPQGPITKITPKIPLMRLSSNKDVSSALIENTSNEDTKKGLKRHSVHTSRNSIRDEKLCSLESFSPKHHKVIFKMLETVHTDFPCDFEEEPLNAWVTEAKACSVRKDSNKTLNLTSNENLYTKKDKVLKIQNRLMKALFDTETCYACRRPLIDNMSSMKNRCGHTFHADCAAGKIKCPDCNMIMNGIKIV